MHRLAVPLVYLALIAAAIAAPIYALSVLFDVAAPIAVAEANSTAAAPTAENAAVQEQTPALQRPVWIAPTRQYNYTPPPLPRMEPAATERAAPAKKEKTKAQEAKRERKPAQEARQPRATPEAMQAFAAEVVPERPINRD